MIDISGFTLSYEVSGLQPIFENRLYTPYFEIGNYTEDKGFKVFYFFPSRRIVWITDNVYHQTVILPTGMTTGPESTVFALPCAPTISGTPFCARWFLTLPSIPDYARTPFIIDLEDEDPYSYDVYTVCQQKMMLIDKNRRIYPYRAATRGDLYGYAVPHGGFAKVVLPAVSPYPDVSPKDPRYAALHLGRAEGTDERLVRRQDASGGGGSPHHDGRFPVSLQRGVPGLTEGTHPTPVAPADIPRFSLL